MMHICISNLGYQWSGNSLLPSAYPNQWWLDIMEHISLKGVDPQNQYQVKILENWAFMNLDQ